MFWLFRNQFNFMKDYRFSPQIISRAIHHIPKILPSIHNLSRSQSMYLETLGLVGLCLYAFAFPFSKDICYIGEWMMVGAFILSLPHLWPVMKSDPLWKAFLLLSAYLIFKGILTFFVYHEPVLDILDAIRFRLRFLWIFMIAWWLGGSTSSVLRIFFLSMIGVIVLIATGYETLSLEAFERGRRLGFGINRINPQHFSLYVASCLCGCLFLAKAFWGNRYKYLRVLLWTGLVLLFLEMTILSQTRTVWISLLAILIFWTISAAIFVVKEKSLRDKKGKKILLFAILLLFLIVPTISFNTHVIQKRTSSDFDTLKELLFQDENNVEFSESVALRFALWKWATDQIKNKPLFGWKIDNTSREFIGKSETIDKNASHFHHSHNTYLEIMLNQGLTGFFIFLFFPVYVGWSIWRLFRKGMLSYGFFMTFCSVAILFAFANTCEAYITSWLFWPYFTIFFGGFYSLSLWNRLSAEGSVT